MSKLDVLNGVKEENLAKALLIKAGILKVNTEDAGTVVVKLPSEDIREFTRIELEQKKLNDLLRQKADIDAMVKAKTLHVQGLKTIWWGNIKDKYRAVADASRRTGVYYNKVTGSIHEGLSGNRYKGER